MAKTIVNYLLSHGRTSSHFNSRLIRDYRTAGLFAYGHAAFFFYMGLMKSSDYMVWDLQWYLECIIIIIISNATKYRKRQNFRVILEFLN